MTFKYPKVIAAVECSGLETGTGILAESREIPAAVRNVKGMSHKYHLRLLLMGNFFFCQPSGGLECDTSDDIANYLNVNKR